MPIWEYRCASCNTLSSVFVRSVNQQVEPRCARCGGSDVQRVVSRFAYHKTEQQVLEEYGVPEPGAGPEAYKDPRQIGRWVEKRFDDMGVELPEEAKTMIQAAREGEYPEPVKDL